MGFADKLRQAACDAAYTVGRGVGKAEQAVRSASEKVAAQGALDVARDAVGRAADATGSLADRVAPTLRDLADRAAPAVQDAADKTAAAARDVARKAVPVVKDAARQAVPVAQEAARRVAPAVKDAAAAAGGAAVAAACRAGGSASGAARAAAAAGKAAATKVAANAAGAATKVAVENAAGMRDADARPREVVDPRTGQKVVVEAYVRRSDGSRDYASVYPAGAKGDFGPVGNKLVGMLLIMAGVPMLVLPGPGVAAIAAGLYFLRKGDAADGKTPSSGSCGDAHAETVVPATGVVVTDSSDVSSAPDAEGVGRPAGSDTSAARPHA